MLKISIIGTGYVGLVTGACLSMNRNNRVVCLDKNNDYLKYILEKKKSPFYEKSLDEIIKSSFDSKNFNVSFDMEKSIAESDVTFIAVGTPSNDNGIDLSQIKQACALIAKALRNKKKFHVIVVKSTVEPSTTEQVVKKTINKLTQNKNIGYCMNPEFLRQGFAVNDFINPDRIIIGCDNEKTKVIMKKIYKNFNSKFFFTNIINAELSKYTSNIFLANSISFSNEISNICEKTKDSDVSVILETLGYDRRFSQKIGKKLVMPEILSYIKAGIGFGGSCLPKDVLALKNFAKKKRIKTPLIDSIIEINKNRPKEFVESIKKEIGNLKNKKVAVIGLSFKPETDDLRDSPSIKIIECLIKFGAEIHTWDPLVKLNNLPQPIRKKISLSKNLNTLCKNKDCVLLTHSSEFIKNFNWKKFKNTKIFDGRNILKDTKISDDAKYFPLGKGN